MDLMNLNEAAHGDREFGFIGSRMRLSRKVIVGYWQDEEVQSSLGTWTRAACAWHDMQGARIARFGDNMREVAGTQGGKEGAPIRVGYEVCAYRRGGSFPYVEQRTGTQSVPLLKAINLTV